MNGLIVLGGISYNNMRNGQEPAVTTQNEQPFKTNIETSVNKKQKENTNVKYIPRPKIPRDSNSAPIWENNEEIEIFREYLRIPTFHPDVDYKPAVEFITKQAESLDLPVAVHYPVDENNPVVVVTWEGSEPELPTIMLNLHMDVVPAFDEFWTHPPFAAEIDENGDIFARGTQDMKSMGMQHLAAIRALKRKGVNQFKRTVHVVYVPDEETGGVKGMAGFVQSNEFKAMNVGFVLDEGMIALNDEGALYAYYGERTVWQVEFTAQGTSGHGSLLLEDTPSQKITLLLAKLNEFRDEELRKFTELNYPYGKVTTINLTILKGGKQNNVVPAEFSALFDMRISVDTDLDEFEQQLKRWCEGAGGNISMKFWMREIKEKLTVIDDSNPFWTAFKNTVDEAGLIVEPRIRSGGSDCRFVRRVGIPAIGISPQHNTIPMYHDHDEYLNAVVYLEGIEFYEKIIPSLANV